MLNGDFPYEAVNMFLRMYTKTFTPTAVQRYLRRRGFRTSPQEIGDFLDAHPAAFILDGAEYISRAGVFTGKYFSIKPSRFEIDAGILIIGHRCMPFTDPEMLPHELCFCYGKNTVQKKCINAASDDILDMYRLFGEEYVPQYLGLDPGNAERNFAENDFEIPNRIKLTVCDLASLYEKWNFSQSDRLLARVKDWNNGLVELIPLKQTKLHLFESTAADEQRELWYHRFESCLLNAIETYGPCSCIEEQLACAYFGNTRLLCDAGCGSAEEFLTYTKNIAFAEYGVETRLWKKNEEVCASALLKNNFQSGVDVSDTLYAETGLPIPEFMIDAYVLDSLYCKDEGVVAVFKKMVPSSCVLQEWQLKTFLLHLESRFAALTQTYNRFTDFNKGDVRHRALALYSALVELICELDSCGLNADVFPQQDLVILSQLFAHTGRLIEVLLYQESMSESDLSSASASLEGMEYSFEDIEEVLIDIMHNKRKDAFSVVK